MILLDRLDAPTQEYLTNLLGDFATPDWMASSGASPG